MQTVTHEIITQF